MNRTEDIGSYGKNEEYLGEMTGVCQGECLFIMHSAPQIEMDGLEQGLMGRDGVSTCGPLHELDSKGMEA